jgi:hypothetical protein
MPLKPMEQFPKTMEGARLAADLILQLLFDLEFYFSAKSNSMSIKLFWENDSTG